MTALSPASVVTPEKTMELIWARVRQRGDLPGFSKVVTSIIGAMRGDDDRDFNMTRTVLQDPALTQKVLRLANSAMYSVFGQGINTVSKAVIVLGTEAIGHLALGLKLVDGLTAASSESAMARAELEKSVMAGHIARQVVSSTSSRDAEEAVVCSMLHSLGRMLVTFYLPEYWLQIKANADGKSEDENRVAQQVLGLSLDEVGRLAARQWGLPATLVETLKDMPPAPVGEPLDHSDWLAAVSTLSSRCADVLCEAGDPGHAALATLAGSYADMLGLEKDQVVAAVEIAQRAAVEEDAVKIRPAKRAEDKVAAVSKNMGKPVDAASVLARGVADMQGVLQSATAAQLMSMALETVFQGLAFTRVVAFLRDSENSCYIAHMCLGEGGQELLPRLVFSDAYQPDVFHAALANDKMIFVENALDPAFSSKVPRWWKEALPTVRSFTVLPLTVNRHPVGFIYGDWDRSKPPSRIEQAEVGPLNEIRTLLARMMEQRRQAEPAWVRKLF
ncbi:HDOD domain-containing protein [Noviherbaspirillum denitrificans]|uniref:Histidine kinase n=1 Tax=Noviherbaspirillum denitrificans TaxID=1968433 RepID=A0A254TCF6_9BURK|nr:HDOD domain-containing protein [Noviherbaspirillum denitrificans]OWW20321.1 histidine kinase [Noviherbaspirillum denitrificans]